MEGLPKMAAMPRTIKAQAQIRWYMRRRIEDPTMQQLIHPVKKPLEKERLSLVS